MRIWKCAHMPHCVTHPSFESFLMSVTWVSKFTHIQHFIVLTAASSVAVVIEKSAIQSCHSYYTPLHSTVLNIWDDKHTVALSLSHANSHTLTYYVSASVTVLLNHVQFNKLSNKLTHKWGYIFIWLICSQSEITWVKSKGEYVGFLSNLSLSPSISLPLHRQSMTITRTTSSITVVCSVCIELKLRPAQEQYTSLCQ